MERAEKTIISRHSGWARIISKGRERERGKRGRENRNQLPTDVREITNQKVTREGTREGTLERMPKEMLINWTSLAH